MLRWQKLFRGPKFKKVGPIQQSQPSLLHKILHCMNIHTLYQDELFLHTFKKLSYADKNLTPSISVNICAGYFYSPAFSSLNKFIRKMIQFMKLKMRITQARRNEDETLHTELNSLCMCGWKLGKRVKRFNLYWWILLFYSFSFVFFHPIKLLNEQL